MSRALVESIGFAFVLAATLFGGAGTFAWPMAWAVLGFYALLSVAGFLLLPRDLIEERSGLRGGTAEDLAISGAAFLFLMPLSLLACGLHVRAQGGAPPATALRWLAFGVFAAGYVFALWASYTNRFFSAAVRVQNDRGHVVVDRGPYAWIRHPGYAGAIAGHLALPIALGSRWGLVPAAIGGALLMVRIGYEERVLREGLAGYVEYAERVRWRLLPHVW